MLLANEITVLKRIDSADPPLGSRLRKNCVFSAGIAFLSEMQRLLLRLHLPRGISHATSSIKNSASPQEYFNRNLAPRSILRIPFARPATNQTRPFSVRYTFAESITGLFSRERIVRGFVSCAPREIRIGSRVAKLDLRKSDRYDLVIIIRLRRAYIKNI